MLPWVQLLWDSLSFLDFLKSMFFVRLGKFSFIMFSNKFSISFSSSSPSSTPVVQMLERLKMSWRFLSQASPHFFEFLFLHSVLVVYLFLLVQTVDLSPSVLPFTVGSLYFTLYSLHFFLYFVTKFNQFCEHPDYQCFELCI